MLSKTLYRVPCGVCCVLRVSCVMYCILCCGNDVGIPFAFSSLHLCVHLDS